MYLFTGKNPGIIQSNVNTIDPEPDEYIVAKVLKVANIPVNIEEYRSCIEENSIVESSSGSWSSCPSSSGSFICKEQGETAGDALNYLSGWVAYKYKLKFPELGNYTNKNKAEHSYSIPSWVQHLSFGGLIQPSDKWFSICSNLEKWFTRYHRSEDSKISLRTGKGVVTNLVKKIMHTLSEQKYLPAIKSFIKQRTFIRMNYLNLSLLETKKNRAVKRCIANSESDTARKRSKKLRKILQ